jgi:hypothetical protein
MEKNGKKKRKEKSKVFNLSYSEKQKTFHLSSKRQDIKRRIWKRSLDVNGVRKDRSQ